MDGPTFKNSTHLLEAVRFFLLLAPRVLGLPEMELEIVFLLEEDNLLISQEKKKKAILRVPVKLKYIKYILGAGNRWGSPRVANVPKIRPNLQRKETPFFDRPTTKRFTK